MNGSLLNKRATRKFILDQWAKRRKHWPCERVSTEAMDIIEAKLRSMIISMIEGHPSIGKTFRP